MGCPHRSTFPQPGSGSLGAGPGPRAGSLPGGAICSASPGNRDRDPFWFIDMVPVHPLPRLPLSTALAFHRMSSEERGTSPPKFWGHPRIPLPVGSCAQAGRSMSLSFLVPNPPYPSCRRPLHTSAPADGRDRERYLN